MAKLRLFASIREVAGNRTQLDFEAATVGELLEYATHELGEDFKEQIQVCRIWLNGEPTNLAAKILSTDEVALLPPVSGGQLLDLNPISPNPLNIGLVSFHTSPFSQPGHHDSGGLNVYVQEMAFALAHRGHDCTIYVRKTSADQPDFREIEPGVKIAHIEAGDFDLTLEELPEVIDELTDKMADLLDAQTPDILHANYWLSGVAAHQLKHEFNIPLITTFHTLGKVKEKIGESVSQRRIAVEAEIVQCSEAISVVSKAEAADLINLYAADPKRIHILSAGVNRAYFSPGDQVEARKGLGLEPQIPVLLFVGRIQPLKQLNIAVETLAALADPTAQLLVLGAASGPSGKDSLENSLKLAAQLGVAHRIHLVNPQPHHFLSTYYRAADLVIMPSLSESFGLVALEAAACGIPVIASKVGGLKNLIQHKKTGYLIAGNDPQDFASAVAEILEDGVANAEMAFEAANNAANYLWANIASDLAALYESCMKASFVEC